MDCNNQPCFAAASSSSSSSSSQRIGKLSLNEQGKKYHSKMHLSNGKLVYYSKNREGNYIPAWVDNGDDNLKTLEQYDINFFQKENPQILMLNEANEMGGCPCCKADKENN